MNASHYVRFWGLCSHTETGLGAMTRSVMGCQKKLFAAVSSNTSAWVYQPRESTMESDQGFRGASMVYKQGERLSPLDYL